MECRAPKDYRDLMDLPEFLLKEMRVMMDLLVYLEVKGSQELEDRKEIQEKMENKDSL
jgi:rRNA pseudouridine-1189 N-methylase Emg1 (Nep1/Mra1 family)